MGSIEIATMGKYSGPPAPASSAKFGGGGDGGIFIKEKPKPIIRVKSIQHKKTEGSVTVTNVEEY